MRGVALGRGCHIEDGARLGHGFDRFEEPTVIGDDATVRSGTVVYAATGIGDRFTTGHHALVREHTTLGDDVLVGTSATIDGQCQIGSHVNLQTGAYVPTATTIADQVFIGPYAVLTNDPYPIRRREEVDLEGPSIERGATIGANATILPGVTIGEAAFVAAGSVVTDHVPPRTLAIGVPAEHHELPPPLRGGNLIA